MDTIVSFVTGCDYKKKYHVPDNKSAVLLKVNGKKLSGKQTQHLDIRYFLVTDAVAKGKCEMEWISHSGMNSDYMTKAQSGSEFCRMRDFVMGVKPA